MSYAANGSGTPSTNRINNSGYTFDSAGNVTNDGSLAYAYDAASRLKTAGGDAYQYDGDGHRVRNQASGYSNALYYLWSSVLNQPVVEIDSTTPSVFRAYVYGAGGQMLALQSYDGNFYWLHSDALGSGRKMTNSSGTVIYRGEYDPHGQMVYEWASGGATYLNSHKFTGYERDWSTNLNNAKARTYNHNRARFIQPDPLGLGAADATNPQSLNLYSYVENDPVNFVDPSGFNLEYPGATCFRFHYYNPTTEEGYWGSWTCFGGSSSGYGGGGGSDGGGGGGNGTGGIEDNQQDSSDQQREKLKKDCLARKQAEATQGYNQFKAGWSKRVLNSAYRGATTGAIRGGIAGAGVGSVAWGVGAIPGALIGGLLGGTGGFYGGTMTGVISEPLRRWWYRSQTLTPALNRAEIECDIEVGATLIPPRLPGQ